MTTTLSQTPSHKYQVQDIEISRIFLDNEFNVRGPIDVTGCIDLALDVAANGLDQPIHIRPYNRKPGYDFQVLAGHRRLTAFKINKALTIPAFIRLDLADDYAAAAANLRENVQRVDLNIMQEAKRIGYLLRGGFSPMQISNMIGKTIAWIEPRKNLVELPPEVQDLAYKGIITQSHIGQLYAARKDPERLLELMREIRRQHEAGEKIITIQEPRTTDDVFRAKKPKASDIGEIRDLIFKLITNRIDDAEYFPNVLLSWTLGDVPLIKVLRMIEAECDHYDLEFELPHELEKLVAFGTPKELQAA